MMTREEAIVVLEESKRQNEVMRDSPSTFWTSQQMAGGVKNAERRIAALELALTALRPVSREQVERMFPGCPGCDSVSSKWEIRFCPFCGKPRTDEAVEMVMERLEALKDGKDRSI